MAHQSYDNQVVQLSVYQDYELMKLIFSVHFENLRNLVDYICNSMHEGTMAQVGNETKGISGGKCMVMTNEKGR